MYVPGIIFAPLLFYILPTNINIINGGRNSDLGSQNTKYNSTTAVVGSSLPPPYYGPCLGKHFYSEKTSALSCLVGSHRIAPAVRVAA